MQLNGTQVVDRHNRPTVIQKVALRAFFINDGEFYDPNDISGVTIFQKASNFSPSTVLGSNNILASSIPSDIILMHFTPSADDGGTAGQDPSGYNPGTDILSTSGVYRISKGEYMDLL